MSALVLSLVAATSLSDGDTNFLIDRFRQASIRGQAIFQKEEIRVVENSALATDVRRSYGRVQGAKFYEIRFSSPAYLVTWDRKPKGTYYTQGCALVARDLPYIDSLEKVLNVQFSSRERGKLREVENRALFNEFPLPEEGKKITLDRLYGGRFVALQVSAMSQFETRDWKNSPAVKNSPLPEGPKQ